MATAELQAIQTHIEDDDPMGARRFVRELQAQCEKMAGLPGTLGTAQPELQPNGLRSTTHKGYVILFRYTDDNTVEIVSVSNGRLDMLSPQTESLAKPPLHQHSELYESIWGDRRPAEDGQSAKPLYGPKHDIASSAGPGHDHQPSCHEPDFK